MNISKKFPSPSFSPVNLAIGWLFFSCGVVANGHEETLTGYENTLDPSETSRVAMASTLRVAPVSPPVGAKLCRVRIALVDIDTGDPVPGLLRVRNADGAILGLTGLMNRGVMLNRGHAGKDWYAVVEPTVVEVPGAKLWFEAIGGFETERAVKMYDFTGIEEARMVLPLRRFYDPAEEQWHSGNTHLHLYRLTRPQADDYLRTIPRADGLELLFVSYLTRAREDHLYVSNTYTAEQLEALNGKDIRFGWGEEHRHNSFPLGHGYGHVMLLNLPRLIEPVSVGREIMNAGPDYPPLRHAIDVARSEGGVAIWCHNANGSEDLPNLFSGRIDALNLFEAAPGGKSDYSISHYRYLNVGLKVPFSGGTDWFIHSFARAYAKVEGNMSAENWLAALKAGRSFLTNGTFLDLRAGSYEIGDTIALSTPETITFSGRARGRNDFGGIDLVHNGKVVSHAKSSPVGGHFEAELEFPLGVHEPGWVALRVAGGSFDTSGPTVLPDKIPFPAGPAGYRYSEMGAPLFGHTSAIYLEFEGRLAFVPEVAESMIEELENNIRSIEATYRFETEAQQVEVLTIYRDAIAWLRHRK